MYNINKQTNKHKKTLKKKKPKRNYSNEYKQENKQTNKNHILKFAIFPSSFCYNFLKFPFSLLAFSVRLVPNT